MKPVIVISHDGEKEFEEESAELIKRGYQLIAASCGFVNSPQYDFLNVYQGIFVHHTVQSNQIEITVGDSA